MQIIIPIVVLLVYLGNNVVESTLFAAIAKGPLLKFYGAIVTWLAKHKSIVLSSTVVNVAKSIYTNPSAMINAVKSTFAISNFSPAALRKTLFGVFSGGLGAKTLVIGGMAIKAKTLLFFALPLAMFFGFKQLMSTLNDTEIENLGMTLPSNDVDHDALAELDDLYNETFSADTTTGRMLTMSSKVVRKHDSLEKLVRTYLRTLIYNPASDEFYYSMESTFGDNVDVIRDEYGLDPHYADRVVYGTAIRHAFYVKASDELGTNNVDELSDYFVEVMGPMYQKWNSEDNPASVYEQSIVKELSGDMFEDAQTSFSNTPMEVISSSSSNLSATSGFDIQPMLSYEQYGDSSAVSPFVSATLRSVLHRTSIHERIKTVSKIEDAYKALLSMLAEGIYVPEVLYIPLVVESLHGKWDAFRRSDVVNPFIDSVARVYRSLDTGANYDEEFRLHHVTTSYVVAFDELYDVANPSDVLHVKEYVLNIYSLMNSGLVPTPTDVYTSGAQRQMMDCLLSAIDSLFKQQLTVSLSTDWLNNE